MIRSNSLKQAAIVLSSLPESLAAQLLSKLQAGDMKSVLDAAKLLDEVSPEQVDHCVEQLRSDSNHLRSNESSYSESQCQPVSPEFERAKIELDRALLKAPKNPPSSDCDKSPFGFLEETIPTLRSHVLADEHPRSIAIVLSTFSPDVASETMATLETNQRISVLKRMCELDEIRDDEVTELSYGIRMRLNKLLNSSVGKKVGLKSAADLLSCSDAATREALLARVEQTDPDLADRLQQSVFKIEQLVDLADQDIKRILRNVDTSCWAPALKNAKTTLIDKILNNMAEAPRELLSHEIAEIGYVDETHEDLARKNIVNSVLRLGREGKVDIQHGPAAPHALFPEITISGGTDPSGLSAAQSGVILD